MAGSGITYRELAERTGLSAGYLNHIVRGRRPVPERELIAQIAKALGAEPDFFFDYRLVKVVAALEERPDLVNDLLARFGGRRMAESASRDETPPAAAQTTAEPLSELEAAGDEAADGWDDVLQPCVVPGCESPGKHKLGVRCRVWHEPSPIAGKSKTSALWAPDSDAFLCDQHALGGAHITLILEPNDSGETAVKVIAAPHANDRRTPIRHEPRESGRTKEPDNTVEPAQSEGGETSPMSTT
jgi:transcriptional regulator with XRE-family HTH domain